MACNGCNKKWLNSHGSKPPTHRSKGFFGDDGELPHVEEVVINGSLTPCACSSEENSSGVFCDRHKCWKTPDLVQLCKKRKDYFDLWEQGRGPMQSMYENVMKEGTKIEKEKEEKDKEILERDYFMSDPNIPKKSRGLGDTVAKITKATGIKAAVDTVFDAMDKDCGCKERQSKLNKLFPYGKKKKTKGFFE
jgi:hypothetical protein